MYGNMIQERKENMGLDSKMRKKILSLGLAFGLTVTSVPVWQAPVMVQAADEIVALAETNALDSFGVMTESGSRNTWLFTGGTETVADFRTSGTTRNYVGLFEDNLRAGGTFVERGRFVFNTAKRNADIASVLADYDTMIAPYGTKAVGIMIGASDYEKGTEGVSDFKVSLQALLEKLYADEKLPFIITPYPSADGSADAQIAEYVDAIREVAGERTRVVDISEMSTDLVQEDGSLTPAGHQNVANTVKSTLGITGATSFAFDMQDGSYTVAKKTDDGAEAQVEAVTAGKDSIQVRVDPSTMSGKNAQLTYTLTDTKGQKISGSAAAGQATFTVGGLKQGETYTVQVYDIRNKEEEAAITLDSVRKEAEAVFASDKKAFDLDLADQIFDGTGVDYSSNADYIEVLNNLRTGEDDQTLILRFKTTQTGMVLLFGAGAGNATDGTDMIIGMENGKVRIAPRNDVGGNLLGSFAATLNDGNYHTLALSFLPSKKNSENNLRMVIDGGADIYGTNQYAKDWYKTFIPGFNQKPDTVYSALKIGGTGFKTTKDEFAGLTGNVESVTLINRAYTVEELQAITGGDQVKNIVKESYQPVSISVVEGAKGVSREYEDGNISVNEKIQSLLTSEEPVTYLFMGDSITHGILTQGYDNVPQMFAKYLDELGRTDDVVLNTGVSNATIATTLDQIDTRLEKFKPDVVMVMLGTNDVSYNGENTVTNGVGSRNGITAEEFKERYKQLVQKIYDNNADSSIVLRVPCEMLVDDAHSGYEDKFAAIYDVAEEMRQEIAGLNITVVDHRQEWLDYKNNVRNDNIVRGTTYGWLVDIVHPNGRGNMSMFQQIIKELGLYVNTSEMANYQYALDSWTGTDAAKAPVTQKATRASFAMSALSGYANGLKNVTLTLAADGTEISKTAEYAADGTIVIDGLDTGKSYTAKVTGKDRSNSKEITFDAVLTKETDVTATADEKKELTDSIAEAKKLDVSAYPAEVRKAYEAAIRNVEENLIKDSMTVAEVDEALAQVRLVRASLDQMTEQAKADRKAAKADLDKALAATEGKHQAGKANWTEESWNAYEAAYQAAKAADQNTEAEVLKQLLAKLKDAEAGLKAKSSEKPEPAPEQKLVEGQIYTVGNYRYKLTSLSDLTVEAAGLKAGASVAKISIGSTVKLDGRTFRITSVGASAFKGNKKAASVVVGKNVVTIGKNAFAGCIKLKKAVVKSSKLKQIGSKAFFNCRSLKSITIKSKVLKSAGKNAFKGINKKAVIKVPSAKLKAYKKLLAKKGQSGTVKIK